MRKRILFSVLTLMLLFGLQQVHATLLSQRLPGGKNYIDEANIRVTSNTFETIDSIFVKKNTYYTLTLPSSDVFGDVYLLVIGETEYIDDMVSLSSSCYEELDKTVCTFYTNHDFVDIQIMGDYISMFYDYYGLDQIQLEEGQVSTSYEPYIAPLQDTTSPEFSNSGVFITSYKDQLNIEEIIASHVVAIDEVDGDLSSQIQIVSDNYTANKSLVGDYSVFLEVSDSSSNKASFELIIMVKDEIAPVIIGPDHIEVQVDDIRSLPSIISEHYSCSDEYDTQVACVVIEDQYSNQTDLGTYSVTIESVDSSNNTSVQQFFVSIIDDLAPVLESSTTITVAYEDNKSITSIINDLLITDNHSTLIGKTVLSDGYTNYTSPGTYFVDLRLNDESNNESVYSLQIDVIDTSPPEINGVSNVIYSYTQDLTIDHLRMMLSVTDNVSSLTTNDIIVIQDTYTNRSSETGIFVVEFQVFDEQGLSDTHIIQIEIIDDQAPVIFVDDYIVKVTQGVTFTEADAIRFLQHKEVITDDDFEVKTLINEYSGNEEIPGLYRYQVEVLMGNGDRHVKEFIIEVVDESNPSDYTSIIALGISSLLLISVVIYTKKK